MALFLLGINAKVFAAPLLFEDEFNNTTYIDQGNTNAYVDTLNGYVQLPSAGQDVLDVKGSSFPTDVILLNGNNVDYYSHDGSGFIKNTALSVTMPTSPVAVSLTNSGNSYWILKDTGKAVRMDFDGTSMVENPLTSITGVTSPVSISEADGNVVIQDGSTFKTYGFDGSSMVEIPALAKDTASSNPVNAIAVNSSPDVVFVDNQGFTYYGYDGSGLTANPFKEVTGLNIISADYQQGDGSYIYLDGTGNINWLSFDGSGYVANSVLTTGPVTGARAIAVAPDSPYYLVRTGSEVKTFMFDGSQMNEAPSFSIAGLSGLSSSYLYPKQVQSTVVNTTYQVKSVYYEAYEALPVGTSISYYFSNDGGATWQEPDASNVATFAYYGQQIVYRALLDTTVDTETPLLHNIKLYDYTLEVHDFLITDIVHPPNGNPPLPTNQKVYVGAGYDFSFEVKTRGAAAVDAFTSDGGIVNMTPAQPIGTFENIWSGTYATDPDLPDGTRIDIEVVADGGTGNLSTLNRPGQVEIKGSIKDDLIINQVK